jgi:hypothetical protein
MISVAGESDFFLKTENKQALLVNLRMIPELGHKKGA